MAKKSAIDVHAEFDKAIDLSNKIFDVLKTNLHLENSIHVLAIEMCLVVMHMKLSKSKSLDTLKVQLEFAWESIETLERLGLAEVDTADVLRFKH